jgi:hypothetical protein
MKNLFKKKKTIITVGERVALPNKHEALSSNPSTAKKKKNCATCP